METLDAEQELVFGNSRSRNLSSYSRLFMVRRFPTNYRLVHNTSVPNSSAEPPETFAKADERFKDFLAKNGFSQNVYWVGSEDIVVEKPHHYWVRQRPGNGAEQTSLRYVEGIARGLGVELRAVCSTAEETYATVYFPKDDVDAQYHLIGPVLKLSCPTEKATVRKVRNGLKWFWLLRRDKGRSRWLLE